jgi:hypothetical protein
MRIYRWKHLNWQMHLLGILQGFAELADGIVTVGSLGFFGSRFELDASCYRARKSFDIAKKIRENKESKLKEEL